jgi:hypothetical protein
MVGVGATGGLTAVGALGAGAVAGAAAAGADAEVAAGGGLVGTGGAAAGVTTIVAGSRPQAVSMPRAAAAPSVPMNLRLDVNPEPINHPTLFGREESPARPWRPQ